ncbi:MAG TPA: hypothetical protein VFB74_30620 [Kribbellaceae bacterium]|nr:hypothetical protein [Kribbellaceae bacterium]
MSGLREALLAIRDEHGELHPELVVDVAKAEDHPLHSRFEWNDELAGAKYRRIQAHRLIRVAQLPLTYADHPTGPSHIRAFVAVPRADNPQPDYQPTEEAMAHEFTRKLVLQEMERAIAALQRKYGHLSEFADALSAIAS